MRRITFTLLLTAVALIARAAEPRAPARVTSLKITILSTMLTDGAKTLGEWGFAALVEVDGHRILFDTGAHTDVVLKNAQALKIDLTNVPDVVLSHFHGDHTSGFLTLRESVLRANASALARTHVGEGIFLSRAPRPGAPDPNPMPVIKPAYEATGGKFVLHAKPVQLFPGVWLTGHVPRQHAERNWSGNGTVRTPQGVIEDTVPEDMSLVCDTPQGLVIITGCGHAGVVNIIEHARATVRPARVHALIGGIHLFNADDAKLQWTAGKLKAFGVDHFIGAHCTGLETVYRFRRDLGLDRARAVVGAVGQSFELGRGIDAGMIAK